MDREEIAFTAQEARNNANSSYGVLKRIFKLIKEFSKDNEVELEYSVNSISGYAAQTIINSLEQNGYSVVVKRFDAELEEEVEIKEFTKDLKDIVLVIHW